MTEEEAKTKWCPFARVITVHTAEGMIVGPGNRTEICGEDHFTKPMGSFCIGSACMAWRWDENEPVPFTDETQPPNGGYCGLAGQP